MTAMVRGWVVGTMVRSSEGLSAGSRGRRLMSKGRGEVIG